ncbi:MAG: FxsA family protein [Endozoicomonas sp. (ex Botrylloides leachii)]|nr:FxsA family protein [Endozoicomonas sp. (ex Botrylloides leachii)]
MRFFFILFIILPILEIFVFIKVGSIIGALNTVALVILGGVIGLYIIRQQGFRAALRARAQMSQGQVPAMDMIESFFMVIAGLLIMLPGFISDILGIALLIPLVRQAVLRKLLTSASWKAKSTRVYEGEFYRDASNDKGYVSATHSAKKDPQKDTLTQDNKKNENF